jgi:hypothetical protein
MSYSSSVTLFSVFIRCHENVLTQPLLSNGLFHLSGVMSQYDRHDRMSPDAGRLRISSQCSALYRLTQKSVTLKYSLVLTGMFLFKPASECVERYHSVESCALNVESFIPNNFCKFNKY